MNGLASPRLAREPRLPRAAHVFRHGRPTPQRPTMLAFDLDPGPPATIVDARKSACWHARRVRRLGLGLPEDFRLQGAANLRAAQHGEDVRRRPRRSRRAGGDVRTRRPRGDRLAHAERPCAKTRCSSTGARTTTHKTTVSVYSLRARPRPTVSTPGDWEKSRPCCARSRRARFTSVERAHASRRGLLARARARADCRLTAALTHPGARGLPSQHGTRSPAARRPVRLHGVERSRARASAIAAPRRCRAASSSCDGASPMPGILRTPSLTTHSSGPSVPLNASSTASPRPPSGQ